MNRTEIVDLAISHADSVLVLKRRRREFAELQQVATEFRHAILEPAEQHALETRAALDKMLERAPGIVAESAAA